jgi:peptide/nickel transport system permease protein
VVGLILRRLLLYVPTTLLVTFGVFGLVLLIPGDAAVALAGGESATPERVAQVRDELHLDDPFLVRYGSWLKDAVRGDLGKSMFSNRTVTSEIRQRFPITASIVLAAVLLGLLLAVPTGILAGMRPGGRTDRLLMFGTTLGIAVPNFWLAMILILVFAVNLHWLPAIGFTRLTDDPVRWLKSIILPGVGLAIGVAASQARQIRAALADTMNSSYIRTAWAKGAATETVVVVHALKNAAIPAVTILGLQIGGLLGGAVIVEQIFAIPGLGTYVLGAVRSEDLPVIQGVVLMFVAVHMTMNLLVDISYGFLNPKVRVT